MEKCCAKCSEPFVVSSRDLAFYREISPHFLDSKFLIPPPTFCPDCRQQRRLSFRNERNLYHRHCDSSGKKILSVYSPEKPYVVYESAVWWSDAWDPLEYGREFDFSKPFFPQFDTLLRDTPHLNLSNTQSENSKYSHNASCNKDSYLIFAAGYNEGCLYSSFIQHLVSCVDCFAVYKSELCYECIDCLNAYRLSYSQNCRTCSESYYLYDCVNCQNCVACVGLRNKSYYWLNQPVARSEFERRLSEVRANPEKRRDVENAFDDLKESSVFAWSDQRLTEDCTGDHIFSSRNCMRCFDVRGSEDCSYCYGIVDTKNSFDVIYFGLPGELLYECNNIGLSAYRCLFSSYGYGSSDIFYCYNSHYCKNCFGCANIHHREFCVFNRQYSEEEYEKLVSKIIAHMQETKEWGEFFPSSLSPFAYNETSAVEYFPITRNDALRCGVPWRDVKEAPSPATKEVARSDLPDIISEVADEVVAWAIRCEATGRLFRITKKELEFYRQENIPLPRVHPDERYRLRFIQRNPRFLWSRDCASCGETMQTSYAPESNKRVFCEKCYLEQLL